jgi:triacylglycerol esterase/lipase EstA (alpha/beta hydrolase family)
LSREPHHLLLVPGFFGFTSFGEFAYFEHVRDYLSEVGPRLGIDGRIAVVHTIPTASLRRRAAVLIERVAEILAADGGTISLVGHSSGGLDARLATTPEVSLPTSADVQRCASRVRSIVTISTPHHGTPVAHLFNSLLGQQLLGVLSLATIYGLRAGRLPLSVVLRLAGWIGRRGARPGPAGAPASGVLDHLWRELLADFSLERRRAVEEFFTSVRTEQDLVAQITPAGMDVFNASTDDRPGVRYGCVVTRARPPGLRSAWHAGLDPYAQATHALYVALYRIARRTPRDRLPPIHVTQARVIRAAYGRIERHANDGMIPTLSQVHGEVIHAAWADHLDVIGHFHQPTHVPPHFDWLHSGTGFDRPQFERLWSEVAAWCAAEPGARRVTAVVAPP